MMIAHLYFDDIVVITRGRTSGNGMPRGDARETSYHAPEWEIREVLPGVFSLWTEGMEVPQTVGGYGYSYSPQATTPEPESPPQRKGKR